MSLFAIAVGVLVGLAVLFMWSLIWIAKIADERMGRMKR